MRYEIIVGTVEKTFEKHLQLRLLYLRMAFKN